MHDVCAEVAHDRDRVHPMPEQVAGIQFDADVGGAGPLDQLEEAGRGEDHVLRVQLDGDLDVVVAGERVYLLPDGTTMSHW